MRRSRTKVRPQLAKGLKVWKEAAAQERLEAALILAGDLRLVEAARQRFSTEDGAAAVWTGAVSELERFVSSPGELLLVFTGPEQEEVAIKALAKSRPVGGVVLAVDDAQAASGGVDRVALRCRRVPFSDTPDGWERLYEACVEVAGGHSVALGRRYPVLRETVARRVIRRTALENGLVGLAVFVPGADLPVMTLNQARMILTLASLYGQGINKDRILELVMLVAGGVSFRAVARALVRQLRGLGALVKGATGYAGTLAVGEAAVRYFERGAPLALSKLAPALAELQER